VANARPETIPHESESDSSWYYKLPYLKLHENQWKSYTVEGMAWAVYGLATYGVLLPACFVVESIYMVPLYIYALPSIVYRNTYFLFEAMDRWLP
jgi:hypothetical protein